MQSTKRFAFFLVLLAFLGNLAYGMAWPSVLSLDFAQIQQNAKHLHLQQKNKSTNFMVPCEVSEETEEAEADAEHDFGYDPSAFYGNLFYNHAGAFPREVFQFKYTHRPGTHRNWLWNKQEIIICFQVFRI